MTPRTIADFEALTGTEALNPAERRLIEACRAGLPCILGDARPTTSTPENTIRADLLRVLITGGTTACRLHEVGIRLMGGWIEGQLDLDYARARGQTGLKKCHFSQKPKLEQAQLQMLCLDDSCLPGLWAQGLKVEGSLFLRSLIATGTVAVNGAYIGGQLACAGAILDGNGEEALNAQRVKVGADLFLSTVTAVGTVDVNGADIGGQLTCTGATFDGKGGKALNAQGVRVGASLFLSSVTTTGTVAVNGADIGGQLTCTGAVFDSKGGYALNAQAVKVGTLIWRGLQRVEGLVNLNASRSTVLVDDIASWPSGTDMLLLDGFTFDRIASGPTDAASRLPWLRVGSNLSGTFYPQPYTQLAKVLFDMGHAAEARKILIEREGRLANERWAQDRQAYRTTRYGGAEARGDMGRIWLGMWAARVWSSAIRRVAGYGYAPQRAFYWAAGFIAAATLFYFLGWQLGVMVPNSAVILTSPDWATAMAVNPDASAHAWAMTGPARHYETFYSLAYATDVFVPLVDLGQESAWAATTVTWPGFTLRWFTFALELAGWIVTALGAAAITGIIQRGRE